jgi:hypothetical protein
MLDTIDKLIEATTCSLLDGTGIIVELALAKVFILKGLPFSTGAGWLCCGATYLLWANAGHYPLPVPIDGGDIATLAEAFVQRIQWPKEMILIPPMKRHPNPEATIGSRGTTSDGGTAAQCQQEKAQQQKISKTTQQERRQEPEEEPRQTPPKQLLQLEDKKQTKQQPLQQQERRQ